MNTLVEFVVTNLKLQNFIRLGLFDQYNVLSVL
jgi:hypothetical protein